jgi:hypothetical protein
MLNNNEYQFNIHPVACFLLNNFQTMNLVKESNGVKRIDRTDINARALVSARSIILKTRPDYKFYQGTEVGIPKDTFSK